MPRKFQRPFYLAVAVAVTIVFVVSQAASARADENGFLEDSGLRVETTGVDNNVSTARVDIDYEPGSFGLEIDFNELREDFGVSADQLSQNAGPDDLDFSVTSAASFIDDNTGFNLLNPDDEARFRVEATNILTAFQGYLDSGPADEDPTVAPVVDALDTMLPLMDESAECRGRCLEQGALRVVLLGAVFTLINFTVQQTNVSEPTKVAVEGAMIVLGIVVTVAQLLRVQWSRLSAESQARFTSLGLFTSLNNAVSLLTQSAAIAVDAIGGTQRFAALTLEAAEAVVEQGGAGTPAGGAVAIDMRDDEL